MTYLLLLETWYLTEYIVGVLVINTFTKILYNVWWNIYNNIYDDEYGGKSCWTT